MKMHLKEIAVTADRPLQPEASSIENMSRTVCALLVRGLQKKITTPDFWKISIRINYRDNSEDGKILLGVLVVNRTFPANEFIKWTPARRNNFMLEFVSGTVRDVLSEKGIDTSTLDDAISYVIEHNFKNLVIGKNRFQNPESAEVAHIECEQETDVCRIYVVFKINDTLLRRVLVATTVPEEFIFQVFFGRVEWQDSQPFLFRIDGLKIPISDL